MRKIALVLALFVFIAVAGCSKKEDATTTPTTNTNNNNNPNPNPNPNPTPTLSYSVKMNDTAYNGTGYALKSFLIQDTVIILTSGDINFRNHTYNISINLSPYNGVKNYASTDITLNSTTDASKIRMSLSSCKVDITKDDGKYLHGTFSGTADNNSMLEIVADSVVFTEGKFVVEIKK